jgi:hypothetical protein
MDDTMISALAKARQEKQSVKDAMNMMLASVTDSLEYKSLEMALNEAISIESQILTDVKEMTIKEYEQTGNKKPHPATGIREVTEVDILDPIAAIEWCKFNFSPGLALDEKAFIDFAKVGKAPKDLVNVRKEITATVSKDLSEYLSDVT